MTASPPVELSESRATAVGGLPIRRALPQRRRRTVGAWCFVDHIGPAVVEPGVGVDVPPHPHIGLQTVTWLFDGEAVHRDSLGTEQAIRPGQLNLMTAGSGIVHSEEGLGGAAGHVHGVQLWVAQPEATRHGPSAFEHHPELPAVELARGRGRVLVGSFHGSASPARRDTDHVGVDLRVRAGATALELDARFEHAVVVFDGAVTLTGDPALVVPGRLAYLGPGRSELVVTSRGDAHLLLVGGVPFEPIVMWWNFVARSRAEIVTANDQWRSGADRFGDPGSGLPRVRSPQTPWPEPQPL